MRLIGMDSSSRFTGVCSWLVEKDGPGQMEALSLVEDDRARAEQMISDLAGMLEEKKISLNQVDGVAVATGPGSFTGLRISVTMAKTLSQFTGIPLYGVSSLEAMAATAFDKIRGQEDQSSLLMIPIIDARANRVYGAGYLDRGWDQAPREVLAEDLYYEEDLLPILEDLSEEYGKLVFTGPDLSFHPPLLEEGNFTRDWLDRKDLTSLLPGLCRLASLRASQGEGDSCLDLRPNYLRKSQAELARDRKQDKGANKKGTGEGQSCLKEDDLEEMEVHNLVEQTRKEEDGGQ